VINLKEDTQNTEYHKPIR